ncbi:alpha/beta hydrolase, partial [Pseudomonas syringae]|nr:alpha/beta hydrolase [Pseudomonas syringae]
MRAAKIAGVLMSLALSGTALAETPGYGPPLDGFAFPPPLLEF